ncbi:hypothetical protein E2C01_020751 [Portunus trituberculatus]|uniref:Uncharacterized protein n=1 Tax=Portunus trituberculatus TaxID=210409 RepID=A0A5B7E2L5_PORTR|nr:hypothetical protein [Portunus trituberculatus]
MQPLLPSPSCQYDSPSSWATLTGHEFASGESKVGTAPPMALQVWRRGHHRDGEPGVGPQGEVHPTEPTSGELGLSLTREKLSGESAETPHATCKTTLVSLCSPTHTMPGAQCW